jgi:hypothetical protein
VLFLDFDGVLHTDSELVLRPFSRVPALESCLLGYALDIVISSSWRFHYDLTDLKSRLGALARHVIGVTSCVGPHHHQRYEEILDYVFTHSVNDWRALDDARNEFPPGCENLFFCDPRIGFSIEQHRQLTDWLNV